MQVCHWNKTNALSAGCSALYICFKCLSLRRSEFCYAGRPTSHALDNKLLHTLHLNFTWKCAVIYGCIGWVCWENCSLVLASETKLVKLVMGHWTDQIIYIKGHLGGLIFATKKALKVTAENGASLGWDCLLKMFCNPVLQRKWNYTSTLIL